MKETSYVTRNEAFVHEIAQRGILLIKNTRRLLYMRSQINAIPKMQARWFKTRKEQYSVEEVKNFLYESDSWASWGQNYMHYIYSDLKHLVNATDPTVDVTTQLSTSHSTAIEWVLKQPDKEAVESAADEKHLFY